MDFNNPCNIVHQNYIFLFQVSLSVPSLSKETYFSVLNLEHFPLLSVALGQRHQKPKNLHLVQHWAQSNVKI